MLRRLLLPLLLAALPLAGCLDADPPQLPPTQEAPAQDARFARFPVPLDHDHADARLHHATIGLEPVAFLPLGEDAPQGGVYNLALAGDTLVAVLGSPAAEGLGPGMTLLVVDVADPAAPRALAALPFAGGGVEAVALSDDGRFAFVGTEFTGAAGVWTVDLAERERPRPVAFTPLAPEGPHNLRFGRIGERAFVVASIAHVSTFQQVLLGTPQDSSPVHDLRVDLLAFDPARPEAPLATVSSWQVEDEVEGTALVHDAVLERHPLTGQDLLYVAYWDAGVRVVDVSAPESPVEVGAFAQFAPVSFGIIHTVKPHPGLLDGRHVTVATSQCAYAPDEECHVRILDTTDPARPTQLATWTLPEAVHGPAYTSEIFDLADGRLVVPWGHAGVWALDLARPEAPEPLGYWFPTEPARTAAPWSRLAPFANAAIVSGDHVFLADVPSGIHVLRLSEARPT